MDSSTGIDLHLRIRVMPGRREEFLEFLREATAFYEQPGGIRIELLSELHDSHRFIEVVHYDNEQAYQTDQKRVSDDAAMKAFLTRWRALLAEPPVVEVYRLGRF